MFKFFEMIMALFGRKKKKEKKANPNLLHFPATNAGFLWKPIGEDGNGVVLFPSDMPFVDIRDKWLFKTGTKFITSTFICSDKDGVDVVEDLYDRATHISHGADKCDNLNPNSNRHHARCGKEGGYYGRNFYVISHWENYEGTIRGHESELIKDGSKRQ